MLNYLVSPPAYSYVYEGQRSIFLMSSDKEIFRMQLFSMEEKTRFLRKSSQGIELFIINLNRE